MTDGPSPADQGGQEQDSPSPSLPSAGEVILYGGSFNPPQVAHLLAGAYVLATHDADLWLMPSAHHPFGKQLISFDHRLQMCIRLAEQLGPRASVTAIEAELGGEGRTIDTLHALRRRHPSASFRLLLGADVLHERHLWKGWDQLCRLAPPVFLGRQGYPAPPGFDVEITLPPVSSSEVRRRLANAEPVERLVPRSVLAYIRQQRLYEHG